MARRYSGKKGKSGSKRPIKKATPSWLRYKPEEVEMLIVKLAKEGKTASEIGLLLRDTYGISYAKGVVGKKINKVLREKNLTKEIPEDVMALIKRSISLKKHIEKNPKDQAGKRGLILTESKIKSLVRYYKNIGRMPEGWKYDPKKVRMYVE